MDDLSALVLVNSASPDYREGFELVVPYLDHLGVPYRLHDLFQAPLPDRFEAAGLIVIAHNRLDPRDRRLGPGARQLLEAAVARGCGLLSFDPSFVPGAARGAPGGPPAQARDITVASNAHTITADQRVGEQIELAGALTPAAVGAPGEVLLRAGGAPLLTAGPYGAGRVVTWASARWASARVLGPLAGLDAPFWRSLVWAARKPFVLRGLAPLVGMRVDDVAATGGRWGARPLEWAHAARRYGFKPWMGLFLANLSPAAIAELRQLIEQGDATAFPHAFGRPPRSRASELFYAEALPARATQYDEFIYFDPQHGRAWSDGQAARGLAAVDDWYARHAPLPISRYALAHWYELGANTVPHLADRWGCDLVGTVQDVDSALADTTPWLRLGPFRRYERAGTSMFDPARGGDRPIYYADFVALGGQRVFNCLTEVRDDTGYEWAPDADLDASVRRGVLQLRRALDSMALAVLFTHETDFIYKIAPALWDEQLAQIARQIGPYRPRFVTLDEGTRIVRATRTARIEHVAADRAAGTLAVRLAGSADIASTCSVFLDDSLQPALIDVPPFQGSTIVSCEF
jgi:hypothetical protein